MSLENACASIRYPRGARNVSEYVPKGLADLLVM